MYCEESSETHVTYFPEFCIDRLVPCEAGLVVIPSRSSGDNLGNETSADKRLYILTHPLKQVSKIWSKMHPSQGKFVYTDRRNNSDVKYD